jgi:hypothetical protein
MTMSRQCRQLTILAGLVAVAALPVSNAAVPEPVPGSSAATSAYDSSATAVMQWSYDRWSAPWVQVSGRTHVLGSSSSATLMALECESADLERERLARHLSAAECEHRMAAIRAGQDTSLSFQLDLRVIDFPEASGLARLATGTSIWLEDDLGRRWSPIEMLRGPALSMVRGARLRRVHDFYSPPWVRDTRSVHPYRDFHVPYGGRPTSIGVHRARFAKQDRQTMSPVITRSTRWLRLHLKNGAYEWVATWAFRPDSEVLK